MSRVPRQALGRTGWEVSRLGLGCASYWARPGFSEHRARAVFEAALACGITVFDTGASYAAGAAEERLGRMLAGRGAAADRLFIATKVGTRTDAGGKIMRDFRPRSVAAQLEQSLRRLGLERVALLQLHGPRPEDLTDELRTELQRLRSDGKIALLGVNAGDDVIDTLVDGPEFDALMPFVSVLRPEGATLAARAEAAGLGVLAAEPLARMRFAPPWTHWLTRPSGLWYLTRALTDRLRASSPSAPRTRCIRRALQAEDWTTAQLALAWVLAQPGVSSAVFGTASPEHVRELAAAATRPLPQRVEAAVAACLTGPGSRS